MLPIGTISTPFKQKFGIPRQSQLVKEAQGVITFLSPYDHPDYFRDIENYDHLWLIFHFNQLDDRETSPLVRPPRLGGNIKVGVFASRSPYRPNHLGLSLVKLVRVEKDNNSIKLIVDGVDLQDQTPIYDIKPYLPDVESVPHAKDSWRNQSQHELSLPVIFSEQASLCLNNRAKGEKEKKLIEAVLLQDPRPGHRRHNTISDQQTYGMKLFSYDVRWQVRNETIWVEQIVEDRLDETGENE